ncbi:hypothetical protein JXJ21_17415 [candidate division KSB1 bacterium]|nr:hypothetical protein [candidate division KSB1 bacterium]
MKHIFLQILRVTLFLAILFAGLPRQSFAGDTAINYNKMKRDLSIMKVIFDRMMNPEDYNVSWGNGNTRAVYLEGYGVIFSYQYEISRNIILNDILERDIEQNLREDSILDVYEDRDSEFEQRVGKDEERLIILEKFGKEIDEAKNAYLKARQAEIEARRKQHAKSSEKMKAAKLEEAKIKENMTEFLGEYCDAINQLKPDDQITVIVLPAESNALYLDGIARSFWLDASAIKENQPERIFATVSHADVLAYRSGSIKKDSFEKRIRFVSNETESRMNRDISIMTEIFETGMDQISKKGVLRHSQTWGAYIANFGALFLMKIRNTAGLQIIQHGDEISQIMLRTSEKSYVDFGKEMTQLKSTLIELLGAYGHTLTQLAENEWIGIALELKLPPQQQADKRSTIFIKVKKKDVEDFSKEKLSDKRFRQRVVLTEY